GPALGQRGLNIMEFCKAFNAATQQMEPGLPIPVVITAYSDRTFTFITKTPPATILLKKASGVQSGSKRPNTEKVGKVTRKQLEEIGKAKGPDRTGGGRDAAVRTIAVSARSMSLSVAGCTDGQGKQAAEGPGPDHPGQGVRILRGASARAW